MKQKPFPKEVILVWEDAGDGTQFLTAHERLEDVAEIGETVRACVYTRGNNIGVTVKIVTK